MLVVNLLHCWKDQGRTGRINTHRYATKANCLFLCSTIICFQKEYPFVEVELVEGIHTELENAYNNDEIDLLLCNNADTRGDSVTELVCQERLAGSAAADTFC